VGSEEPRWGELEGSAEVQRGGVKGETAGSSPEIELVSLRAAGEAAIDLLLEMYGEGSHCTAWGELLGARAVQRTRTAELRAAELRGLEAQKDQHRAHRDTRSQFVVVNARHETPKQQRAVSEQRCESLLYGVCATLWSMRLALWAR
jgi:hypothetical protein